MIVTILAIAQLVYIVVISVWILLEKRSPIATVAWILSLIALPYVGLVVFFFLGPRRLVRKRLKHRRARGRIATSTDILPEPKVRPADDPRVEQLVRLATRAGEPPLEPCEDATIFHDAESTYDAIETAIKNAKHHVHVAYYIFDKGRAGTRFCEALAARARAGVTVRLLVDDVGSSAFKGHFLDPLRAAGVKIARFNPVTFSRIRSRIDFRNHRKIVVCDGEVGFTGGINVTDDYLPEVEGGRGEARRKRQEHQGPWRDTHLRIIGDAVRWLQLVFLDDWHYATNYVPRDKHYFPAPTGGGMHQVQIVASGPDRIIQPIQRLYFAAIGLARERVYVTTPYFVPDEAVLTALTTAALRGVDVRVLVPRRSDSLIVTAAARSYYDGVLASGVRVFEYQPTMIHSKTLLVDDFFSAVGTANMDNRSFRLNFEVSAILYGKDHATDLATHFSRDLASALEIDVATRRAVTLPWRFAEATARVFSPLL